MDITGQYEHKCQYCHKFGHPISTCRKITSDKQEKTTSGDRNPENSGRNNTGTQVMDKSDK